MKAALSSSISACVVVFLLVSTASGAPQSNTTPSAGTRTETKASDLGPIPIQSESGDPVYKVAPGMTPPRTIKDPPPSYTKAARKAKIQGTVVLWLVVNSQGLPEQVRVQRTLGYGLDEKAVEAVEKWRFAPATKDGHPVSVIVSVEVNFKLY